MHEHQERFLDGRGIVVGSGRDDLGLLTRMIRQQGPSRAPQHGKANRLVGRRSGRAAGIEHRGRSLHASEADHFLHETHALCEQGFHVSGNVVLMQIGGLVGPAVDRAVL